MLSSLSTKTSINTVADDQDFELCYTGLFLKPACLAQTIDAVRM